MRGVKASPLLQIALVSGLFFAGAAEAQGSVAGWYNATCNSPKFTSFNSVDEACRASGIKAYSLESENFDICHLCGVDTPTPGPVIVLRPCPSGQHGHGLYCHANHVCTRDQIGGGSQDCVTCGDGKVPNEDGTACQSCPYGESRSSPGVCAADACGLAGIDSAAAGDLSGVKKEPRERGRAFYCLNNQIGKTGWSFSGTDACYVEIRQKYQRSCWPASSRPSDGCNLAAIHTHPYFTKADEGTICGGRRINERRAIEENNNGMSFGPNDLVYSLVNGVDSYVGVSDRSCVQGDRVTSGRGVPVVVSGRCTDTPLPHTPWSDLP